MFSESSVSDNNKRKMFTPFYEPHRLFHYFRPPDFTSVPTSLTLPRTSTPSSSRTSPPDYPESCPTFTMVICTLGRF